MFNKLVSIYKRKQNLTPLFLKPSGNFQTAFVCGTDYALRYSRKRQKGLADVESEPSHVASSFILPAIAEKGGHVR